MKDHINTREMRHFLILCETTIQRNYALKSTKFSAVRANAIFGEFACAPTPYNLA